jgi:hypothetical protein
MAVTANITVSVTGKQTNALDLGTGAFPFQLIKSIDFASGVGDAQADRVFSDRRTLAASATEDIDLAASLTDAFGASITFATIKAVVIVAAAANVNNVNVSRPASNGTALFLAASDGLSVKPGGLFALAAPGAGVTVTAGTGDLITLTNSGGTTGVTYDIVVLGTSA